MAEDDLLVVVRPDAVEDLHRGEATAPLPDDERGDPVGLVELAVDLERPRLGGLELDLEGLAARNLALDAVALDAEPVRPGRGVADGKPHVVVLVDRDRGRLEAGAGADAHHGDGPAGRRAAAGTAREDESGRCQGDRKEASESVHVVGTGVDPVTSRFSGARSTN